MYDLKNVAKDFPWTAVTWNSIEPWRKKGGNWFSEIPRGWGDVCLKYLTKLDKLLEKYNAKEYIAIEQVKEKYGTLRFYYIIMDWPVGLDYAEVKKGNYVELANRNELVKQFDQIVDDFEWETRKVCYNCGTRENIVCYNGWIHYACPECERRRMEEDERRMEELRADFKKKG